MTIIKNKVGAIFIPVRNIHEAREWYCSLLNLEPSYEILFEHLCCIPLDNNGLNLVLDSKIYNVDSYAQLPMFHFNTDNIHEAYQFLKNKGIEIVNHLEDDGHYFTIKDPYGNILMICKI